MLDVDLVYGEVPRQEKLHLTRGMITNSKITKTKERDLNQSYDENPYINRKCINQWTTQNPRQKLRLRNDYGPT